MGNRYYQSSGGYYYKKINGKLTRISKNNYLKFKTNRKQKGGNGCKFPRQRGTYNNKCSNDGGQCLNSYGRNLYIQYKNTCPNINTKDATCHSLVGIKKDSNEELLRLYKRLLDCFKIRKQFIEICTEREGTRMGKGHINYLDYIRRLALDCANELGISPDKILSEDSEITEILQAPCGNPQIRGYYKETCGTYYGRCTNNTGNEAHKKTLKQCPKNQPNINYKKKCFTDSDKISKEYEQCFESRKEYLHKCISDPKKIPQGYLNAIRRSKRNSEICTISKHYKDLVSPISKILSDLFKFMDIFDSSFPFEELSALIIFEAIDHNFDSNAVYESVIQSFWHSHPEYTLIDLDPEDLEGIIYMLKQRSHQLQKMANVRD